MRRKEMDVNAVAERFRTRSLLVVLVAFFMLVGPIQSSEAAFTPWETIGGGWAYGGWAFEQPPEGPNNGIDESRASITIGTNTAIDPRRIRLVVTFRDLPPGSFFSAQSISWALGCVDTSGNLWTKHGRYEDPQLPFRQPIYRADIDGRVEACTVELNVIGRQIQDEHRLRVKIQARYLDG